jgi:SpoVK/Ycf46/Vps4 family AAA+-type ATPase
MPQPNHLRSRMPRTVLIGPPATGKSTLGALLAAKLGLPFVDLDDIGDPYYAEVGWSIARVIERINAVGRLAAEIEWEPARAHAVPVVALGVGHTSYTDPAHRETVLAALKPCPDVLHILPSPDREVSLDVLRTRCIASKGGPWIADGHDFLATWLDDPTPRLAATCTVYTANLTPDEVVTQLVSVT